MSKGTGKKIAIGTLIAGVAGYVTGILTAPKSGKQTRKDIEKSAVNFKKEAEKNLKKLHGELDELIHIAKTGTKDLQSGVKNQASRAVSTALETKEKVREVLSSIHEGGTDDKELKKAIKEANDAIKHLKKYIDQYGKAIKKSVSK